MIEDIQVSAEGMSRRIAQQEVIANNLANVNTVGFKRDKVFQDILTDATSTSTPTENEVTVFEQGSMRETKNPLNMAIAGEGFFTMQTPEGIRYTRNGNFRLDPTGLLSLDDDTLVLGESGPIEIRGNMNLSERGEVFVDGILVDRLQIVTFEQPYALRKAGNSLFFLNDPSQSEIEVEHIRVKQGFLEESNVNPIEEMVAMMTLYRYFEADQKAIQTQDEILQQAVNEIGKV